MFASSWKALENWLGLNPPESTQSDDRRAWGRFRSEIETSCCPAGPSPSESSLILVRNVSQGGIGFYSSKAFEPGTLLSVELPDISDDDHAEVLACVVRCEARSAGRWEIGCTFSSPLLEEELDRFVEQPSVLPCEEQRTHSRFPIHTAAKYRIVSEGESALTHDATILNISEGGLALRLEDSVLVGTLLSVELLRDSNRVLTALASVTRCHTYKNGDRVAGCNFIQDLPESQLRLLLEDQFSAS